ncbi:hypothetical protein [Salmonella phage SE131]|uniref:Uncharacterized protein n=1 Tax=Salmonella phage SE131 TaxID=2081631 RepID=A0A2P1CAA8_9CAUD|nr:hypothetical protein PQC35_gp018 [Salmonella phage SE131]AVJ48149.1 hypothetical protein [Salmonella phage SE131]
MNSRNLKAFRRNAEKRMNRPSKMETISNGALKSEAVILRGIVRNINTIEKTRSSSTELV